MDGIEAKNYDLYLIEANYSDEELEQRIEKQIENGEFVVGMRVANTHLSKSQWADFILANAKDDSICEMIHQHKEKGEK